MRTEKRLMRIPVVIMTGDQNLAVQGECFAAGATAFLLKPFTTQNVQTILRLLGNSAAAGAPRALIAEGDLHLKKVS